jgi:hypothetical protein
VHGFWFEMKEVLFFSDYGKVVMNDIFKRQLMAHPDFKDNFVHLGFLYLSKDTQKKEFPEIDSAAIQTCIRELFHDYLKPLYAMQIQKVNTVSISDKKQIHGNGRLYHMPVDLQRIVYSYLDYESIFSFKKTCKSGYLLHKAFLDKKAVTLYLVVNVEFTQFRNIPENKIVDSLCNKNTKEVIVFKSLYQALEYAHFLHLGGLVFDDKDAGYEYVPSIWVVTYLGNPAHLKFIQEKIILNKNTSSSAFIFNQREASISFAIIPKNSVQPVLGAVIFSDSSFAGYNIFESVDFIKYMKKQNDKPIVTSYRLT